MQTTRDADAASWPTGASLPTRSTTDLALRALDAALAASLLALLALPLALAGLGGRWQRRPVQGQGGSRFDRLSLHCAGSAVGRCLAALGAARWPLLINILRGELAWVGPRARAIGEVVAPDCAALRPGLINPWFIRCRTAVAFGSEAQCDTEYLAARGLRHDAGLLLRGLAVALLPASAPATPGRVQVGDVAFDNLDMADAVARLGQMLDGRRPQQVSFVNPACVNIAAGHRGYRRVLARADLVLPDGIGIKIGSDLLGTPLKQNVNGTDLFPRLCAMLQARDASIFLLGGQPGVAAAVAGQITQRWPALRIAGHRDGFFSVAQEGEVVAQVRASGADILLVARGVPMQDLFIARHLPLLGVRVAMGVGGLFDFASGRIRRAPMWMRETGLEWVYRLLQEPGRMWRRYLLGNLSFLARVVLQRLGLRRPAADALPQPRRSEATADAMTDGMADGAGCVARDGAQDGGASTSVRAVLFATRLAGADLPVAPDHPAALLPLGASTVVERVLARLAQAGLTEVHIVSSDRPELLRGLLGDGSRWGLCLHWHLAADPARPYAVLQTARLRGAGRLVIGHADRCLAAGPLLQLAGSARLALLTDATLGWSGWASVVPAALAGLAPDCDEAGLAAALAGAATQPLLIAPGDCLSVRGAQAVLAAQFAEPRSPAAEVDCPASWIRLPWGAMSPQALVHPGATVLGPALIGPGCMVQRGAVIGPRVVLSRDVVVCSGTRVEHSLVLPNSCLGPDLLVSQAIVNGRRLRHVRLGVDAVLPSADAVLLRLEAESGLRPSLPGRALAGALLALCAPLLALHLGHSRLRGRAPAWALQRAVRRHDALRQGLQQVVLRCPRPGAGRVGLALATMAALRDVLAGRRCWFGARPRSPGEWYALSADWQRILGRTPLGLLHAPAWHDQPAMRAEASAAADVFHAVLPGALRRWRIACAALRSGLWRMV